MADAKITDFSALTGANLAVGDLLEVVDISDTTLDATGTNKKMTAGEASKGLTVLAPQIATMRPNSTYVTMSSRNAVALAPTLNRVLYVPMLLVPGYAYTNFGTRVIAQAAAGGVLRVGLYKWDQGFPGDLIIDGGTVASDSTGAKYVSISYTALPPVVFVAIVPQVDATGLTLPSPNNNSTWSPANIFQASNSECVSVFYENSVSGALPSTATPIGPASHNAANCTAYAY